jgi:MFS family permease
MSDRRILFAAAFVRALGTGMVGVLLGIYLATLGFVPGQIGVVVGAGLAGGAAATAIAMFAGDRFGRRRFLVALALLGAAGASCVALMSGVWVVGVATFIGMLNGMGRDRGAALALEQAALPETAEPRDRTRVMAWYNVLQDAGHALGSLLAGLPVLLRRTADLHTLDSMRAALFVYVVLMLVGAVLSMRLSNAIEVTTAKTRPKLSRESRGILIRICALFSIDSLGGGFLTTALLSFFFFKRFGVSEGVIGMLFFGARAMNAVSHLGAAWLAARIGLVKTMVFTHIPSSLLLITVPFAPSFAIAAALFLLREGLVEMDVPTRQSYVMAVVRPEERTTASTVTALTRMAAWAIAPSFAGLFMQNGSMAAPLMIGAGMKITYDVLLWRAFRSRPAPEEIGKPNG